MKWSHIFERFGVNANGVVGGNIGCWRERKHCRYVLCKHNVILRVRWTAWCDVKGCNPYYLNRHMGTRMYKDATYSFVFGKSLEGG